MSTIDCFQKGISVRRLSCNALTYNVLMSCTECNPSESGCSSTFIVDVSSPLSSEELSDDNLVRIVNLEATDNQCNQLCWKCLGYDFVEVREGNSYYDNSRVFPKWKSKYPNPPDLIGITRNYADPLVDKPVRDANMNLMRSIPRDYKGGIRNLGSKFKGYKLNELTPNKTRRAQLVNWMMYYREKLFGKTMEQLAAERDTEKMSEVEINPNISNLPSEKMFRKLRLDEVDEVKNE